MPYADRQTQLQYLKDRRKRLKVGRKVNQSPYGTMDMVNNDFKMAQLAPSIKITPPKPPPVPYNRKITIEYEIPINPIDEFMRSPEFIFL